MLQISFKTEIAASTSKIWEHYINFDLRKKWETDLEELSFHGEVKTGTRGTMTLSGMPQINFILFKIIVNKEFTDEVNIPNIGTLIFCHKMKEIAQEKSIIKVKITLNPEKKSSKQIEDFFIGATQDIAATTSRLKNLLENS